LTDASDGVDGESLEIVQHDGPRRRLGEKSVDGFAQAKPRASSCSRHEVVGRRRALRPSDSSSGSVSAKRRSQPPVPPFVLQHRQVADAVGPGVEDLGPPSNDGQGAP